jgi:RNA polymerase sigma-70 factor (ECF subfamily)
MDIAEAIDPPQAAERLSAGDLRERYLSEVFAYVSRRLPTSEDAEDAAAETFQAAFLSLSRLRGQDPRLWLLGIARRKVADSLRKRSRRRESALSDQIAAVSTPHSATEQEEAARAIRRIVMALPEDQREALLLRHLEGLSQAEIAVVLGRSPAAVNSLLQRARARAFREGKDYFLEDLP